MALTVIKNPSDYNFSRSPVMCELETDNMYTSGNFGNKAKFVYYFPPNPSDMLGFVIDSLLYSIQFRFTATVGSWSKIPLRVSGQTDFDYYNTTVLGAFLSTVGFSTVVYNISYIGSGGFSFEAVNPGPGYTHLNTYTPDTGILFTNLVAGTDLNLTNVPRENYKIGIDVYVDYVLVYSADKEPINNRVKFDISVILNAFLEYKFPATNEVNGILCNKTSLMFYVKFKEYYGSPALERATTVLPTAAVRAYPFGQFSYEAITLKAGLSLKWSRVLSKLQLDSYIWSYPLFLTTRPNPINVKINQPEFLFFILPIIYTDAQLKVKLISTLMNGTTTTDYYSAYSGYKNKGYTICFPINPPSGTMETKISTGNIKNFTVTIVGSNNIGIDISPTYTYIPDYEPLGDNKIFLFTNSLGGVDTFRSTGSYSLKSEFEKEVSSRNFYIDAPGHIGDFEESQHVKTDIIKVFSGWQTKAAISWFEELFLAKFKVEYDIESQRYIPIIITSKEYIQHETNVNLRGIEFEYYRQLKSSVTDRLSAGL